MVINNNEIFTHEKVMHCRFHCSRPSTTTVEKKEKEKAEHTRVSSAGNNGEHITDHHQHLPHSLQPVKTVRFQEQSRVKVGTVTGHVVYTSPARVRNACKAQ